MFYILLFFLEILIFPATSGVILILLLQLCFVWSKNDHTHQAKQSCSNKTGITAEVLKVFEENSHCP